MPLGRRKRKLRKILRLGRFISKYRLQGHVPPLEADLVQIAERSPEMKFVNLNCGQTVVYPFTIAPHPYAPQFLENEIDVHEVSGSATNLTCNSVKTGAISVEEFVYGIYQVETEF